MRNIKGVLFDVDGTLMDSSNNQISKSTQLAISKLHKKGIDVIIATGRNHYALGYQLDALKPDYVISCCGALVYDFKHCKQLTYHPMCIQDVCTLVDTANKENAPLLFKYDDAMYLYNNWEAIPWINPEFNKTIDTSVYKYGENQRHLEGSLPLAAMIYGSDSMIDTLRTSTQLQYIPAGVDGFDIVSNGINKGTGAKDLFDVLGTNKEDYLVFGDHYNDMEIFEYMPYGIAMGNAVDALKHIAYDVTDTVGNDGIYKALIKHGIIE